MTRTVSGYSFKVDDLKVAGRMPGISAFMRIRNGADFLEATIRSHIGFFDEIVAVHNQCTDGTPDILARLASEFGERLKVFHYTDRVFPPGSEGHARTAPDSPSSMVNYSNFALSQTTRQVVTKLDDDHLAMPEAIAGLLGKMAADPARASRMYSFSGLNLMAGPDGGLGIPENDPVSGSGDIGFFTVRPDSVFTHDRRFERVPRIGFQRIFSGFLYWHLKYMKTGHGFANYELEANPESRYAARQAAFAEDRIRLLGLPQLAERMDAGPALRLSAIFSRKSALILDRNRWIKDNWAGTDLMQAIRQTTDPAMLAMVLGQAGLRS